MIRPLVECDGQFNPMVLICRHVAKGAERHVVAFYLQSDVAECQDYACPDCFDKITKGKRARFEPACWLCTLKLLKHATVEQA